MDLQLTLVAVFISVALFVGSLTYVGLERSSAVRRRIRGLQRGAARSTDHEHSALGDAPTDGSDREEDHDLHPEVAEADEQGAAPAGVGRVLQAEAHRSLHHQRSGPPGHRLCRVLPDDGTQRGHLRRSWRQSSGTSRRVWLSSTTRRQRQKEIRNGLPDALDLLIVSLEAGLGIDQAILKSAEELRIAYPNLAEELHMITVECRAGKPRIEAFKNFANRTKVDDVRALVAMLVQTDRFGTSIADALRTYAEVSRTKRRQRAEERAAKIGVKLVFPLVFCLFPAFFVVTLGPGIIKFVHAFSSSGPIGGFGR